MTTRNILKQTMAACLGAMLAALSGLTNATCSQANLRGTWYIVGLTGDTQDTHMVETKRCKIVVGSTGAVPATGSSCYARDYTGLRTISISSGSLSVSSACAVTGSLSMCESGTCQTFRIQHAQMARDWNTFSLVGYSTSNPDIVSFFDAVKQ